MIYCCFSSRDVRVLFRILPLGRRLRQGRILDPRQLVEVDPEIVSLTSPTHPVLNQVLESQSARRAATPVVQCCSSSSYAAAYPAQYPAVCTWSGAMGS